MSLNASTRWSEAMQEIRFRNRTRPVPHDQRSSMTSDSHEIAREKWRLIAEVARRAVHADPSDIDEDQFMTPEQRDEYKRKKNEVKLEREKTAKTMDLQYFLEIVDTKHRYGSNLRAYHEEWKKSDTRENFFYWLDHGAGANIELPTVSRQRLESEQIRYLSREERLKYLVTVDEEGRLCWAKNGERITTSTDYKDSIDGILAVDDPTPVWSPAKARGYEHHEAAPNLPPTQLLGTKPQGAHSRTTSATTITVDSWPQSMGSSRDAEEMQHYVNPDLKKVRGLAKLKHISPTVVLDQVLQKAVKPNSWIFVADTSFRLYVGIKQSGAFQHSSFLNGGRIMAAGLISIKDGQLRKLSPLSGHYRPPTRNFRAFEKSLREEGVDVSHTVRSRAYTMLLLLEAYVKTTKTLKRGWRRIVHNKDTLIRPEELSKRKEEGRDKSKSAELERHVLAAQANEELAVRKQHEPRTKPVKKVRVTAGATGGLPGGDSSCAGTAAEEKSTEGEQGTLPMETSKPEGIDERRAQKAQPTETLGEGSRGPERAMPPQKYRERGLRLGKY